MGNTNEPIIGRFYAQHTQILDQKAIERIQNHMIRMGLEALNVQYGSENVLLLNGQNRLILPFNLLEASDPKEHDPDNRIEYPIIGPYANQLYQFKLSTPPGPEKDRLKSIRNQDNLDTTLLKAVEPFGKDSVIVFAHLDYVNGKGMTHSTNFSLNNITNVEDQEAIRKAVEDNQDLVYRIESCKVMNNYK